MSRIFIFVLFFLNSCSTPSQWYWDHKVKELCEKDGGVTVYESVQLSKEEFESLKIPFEWEKMNSKYYSKSNMEYIKSGYLEVFKYEISIIRSFDKKPLGKYVSYIRRGGDVPTGIMHPSSYACSDTGHSQSDLKTKVFIVKE